MAELIESARVAEFTSVMSPKTRELLPFATMPPTTITFPDDGIIGQYGGTADDYNILFNQPVYGCLSADNDDVFNVFALFHCNVAAGHKNVLCLDGQ